MIFDGDLKVVAGAAERWQERNAVRNARRGQATAEIEDSGRIQARLDRLADAAAKVAAPPPAEAVLPRPDILREIGLERVIGQNDFQGIAFLELALAVSRFVGRINIRSSRDRGVGFGTCFMVSPRLLMTNNHVLPGTDLARFSEVEFDYQYDRFGRPLPVVPFALQPETFFMTDVDLDFSLVAVSQQSRAGTPLTHYGWSRLIAEQGKILIGEHLNIIQHPRGQFKQFVSRSNELVDVLDKHLHYVTDTEPGSSGSPVYNDQWEVVALHHSGVPRMIDGDYAAKGGGRWDGRDPNDIDWIANEGIRVSTLVRFIENQNLSGDQARLRDELLHLEPPSALEAAQMAAADAHQRSADGSDRGQAPAVAGRQGRGGSSGVTITIPLRVTIELGEAIQPEASVAPLASAEPAAAAAARPKPASPELAKALAELEQAATRTYYDQAADARAGEQYYDGIDAAGRTPARLFQDLSALVVRTHRTELRYAPAVHVYPWVDLRHGDPPTIRSIYSGKGFDPRELIEADFRIDRERMSLAESLGRESGNDDLLEASLPYNCEHVVPQSWFAKREPMRGDLHHLFACESGCNSFRGNHAYFDFPDFEEALRTDCGKRETGKFEPSDGKGPVARATLYFLLRYPRQVGDAPGELTSDRLQILLDWHRRDPVSDYERHRNAAIAEKQGNRNPLIDFPEWADRIDFRRGIGRARAGEEAALEAVVAKIEALEGHDFAAEAEDADAEPPFGRFEGLPARFARVGERTAQLLAPILYFEQDGVEWPVPEGAVVDGASIPQPFWSVLGGPWEGRYVEASIVHDFYCDKRSRSWRDTHRMFYEAMRCRGVGRAKAKVMYYAVYRFGPRWPDAGEAFGPESGGGAAALTIGDAASVLADAEAIYALDLNLDEIENLAEARNLAQAAPAALRTEAEPAVPALERARLLVVTGGRGTAEDLEAVAREIAELPHYVMAQFERKTIRVVACRDSVTDFETNLRGVVPHGWEDTRRTWDQVPGTYLEQRKRVVIATIADGERRAVPPKSAGSHGSASLAVHECLHGYDYCGGHAVLADPRFLEARERDIAGLNFYQRQKGQAGLEETFAESGARFIAEPGRLRQDCPNLFDYWQGQPAAIETMTVVVEIVAPLPAEDDENRAIGLVAQGLHGRIRLDLRAEGPGGAIGHAAFDVSPDDPAFGALRERLPARPAGMEAAGGTEALYRPFAGDPEPQPRGGRRQTKSGPTL